MIEDYRVVSARIRQELKELEQVTFRADRAIAAAKRQPGVRTSILIRRL